MASPSAQPLIDALQKALTAHASVVWLIPGGSNIKLSVAAMAEIDYESSSRLTILQTDERYVPVDSADNNWHQLMQAGFKPKQAKTFPIILNNQESRHAVAIRYAKTVSEQLEQTEYSLAQLGIGPDCHIAGIKPGSEASASSEFVTDYTWDDFERVTLTFPALRKLDAAIAFVFGADKKPAIQALQDGQLPLADCPERILTDIPKSILYTDQTES